MANVGEADLDLGWRRVVRLGGFLALLAFAGTLFDIVFGSITTGDLTLLPSTAAERFLEMADHPLLGLYHLDLLNMLLNLITVPVYVALFAVLKQSQRGFATLALTLFCLGVAVYVSTNSALAMYHLSERYAGASDAVARERLVAAGEALIAAGEHGGYGVLPGSVLITVASLTASIAIMKATVFRKWVGIVGVLGASLLTAYLFLIAVVPGVETIATMAAAPGGLLMLVWTLAVGIRLLGLGSSGRRSG